MRKKKIICISDSSKKKTGYGRHCKVLLKHLFQTGKYDIVEFSSRSQWTNEESMSLPWKGHGTLPDNLRELDPYREDNLKLKAISHGDYLLEKLLKQEEPYDCIVSVEDFWSQEWITKKPYFDRIKKNVVIWSTPDSLPLYKPLIKASKKIENLWVKAEFATKEFERLGINHVKTMPGLIDSKDFFPLPKNEIAALRQHLSIDEDTFLIGMCSKNQLRKLYITLIEGFSLFKKANPNVKAKLWLHTEFENGGWNIPDAIKEFNLSNDDIITTYCCEDCHYISISPYTGKELPCKNCGGEKSLRQPSHDFGITEKELNLLYNTLDLYMQLSTSGGCEFACVESMFAGIPMATPKYSYGEAFINSGKALEVESNTSVRECHSNFQKAQPYPESVAAVIEKVYKMPKDERKKFGLEGREWALEYFNAERICNEFAQLVDAMPEIPKDINYFCEKNDKYLMLENIESDQDFVSNLYENIMGIYLMPKSEDIGNKLKELYNFGDGWRKMLYDNLIRMAQAENSQKGQTIEEFLVENGKKRLLYIIPESIGDCLSSLPVIQSLREVYNENEWDLYISTKEQYFEIFDHLDYVVNIIPYSRSMDDFKLLEGAGEHKGYFDVVFFPYFQTQRYVNYIHNGEDIETLQK